MPIEDDGFEPPEACIHWCQARTYDLHILDDGASIDLDWWNSHLHDADHDIRLRGRNDDGKIVTEGMATVQRNDLRGGSEPVATDHDGRMTTGYCWPWSNAEKDCTLVADVEMMRLQPTCGLTSRRRADKKNEISLHPPRRRNRLP